ncbi:MAG: pseudouridine synthase [Patescibacteria group bacterium]
MHHAWRLKARQSFNDGGPQARQSFNDGGPQARQSFNDGGLFLCYNLLAMTESVRLNKYLSGNGYCSRREADRLIELGRVFVNNKRAQLGDKVTHADSVRVDGRDRKREPEKIYLLLNKPTGDVVTSGNDFEDLPENVYPVGHLDSQSSGLVILTNDSALAKRLFHPRNKIETEFVVTVDRPIKKIDVGRLQSGVPSEGGKAVPAKVRQLGARKFAIVIENERTQNIKNMCEALGYQILHIMRTRIGSIKIPMSAPAGGYRHLTEKEVRDLKKLAGMT